MQLELCLYVHLTFRLITALFHIIAGNHITMLGIFLGLSKILAIILYHSVMLHFFVLNSCLTPAIVCSMFVFLPAVFL